MTKLTNLGKKDEYGKQVRIEHRGKYTRASRTGGVSLRAQAKAAGVNITVNSQHGVRLSKGIVKGTQVALQNGRLQLRGRYGKGPHKLNLSKSGVSVSSRNALGTFNWIKPNRSSAKLFGVQVRGKKAAQLQLIFMLFQMLQTGLQLLFSLMMMVLTALRWLGVTIMRGTVILFDKVSNLVVIQQSAKQHQLIAVRLSHAPAPWQHLIDALTPQEQLAALCWIILAWGRGATELNQANDDEQLILGITTNLDSTSLRRIGEQVNGLATEFDASKALQDELALLAMLCQQLAKDDADKLVRQILQLDESLSAQQKTCLQETMLMLALDYAGASWQ